ncbi:NACHT, LRR and PYD domains-containing protein 8 [Pipistrellus kuhlii]|uniref:NACHT, LRR and PYD domains-containing protein 8 n=1 Tax=Pipistrellus kuhlii TaxID=59472 RepID=UPI00174EF756|nr:NACHT, LRR and PYD domains-containing protein 8 [Pipistrellus kuhlii]
MALNQRGEDHAGEPADARVGPARLGLSVHPRPEPRDRRPGAAQRTLEEEDPVEVQDYRQQVLDHFSAPEDGLAWPEDQADFFHQDLPRHRQLLSCLFLPRRPRGQPPRMVVLCGAAGVGKTTLARRLMHAWARRAFYAHTAWCAFYVHCGRAAGAGELSMADLLSAQGPQAAALAAKALARPEQLLLVLDGFEDLGLPLPRARRHRRLNWWRKLPVPVLLVGLLSGRLLPRASLLLLLRPSSWRALRPLLRCPSVLTLSGFTAPERTRYLRTYFGGRGAAAEAAVDFLRGSAVLASICQAPAVCWLVCSCLRGPAERGKDLFSAFPNATALFAQHLSRAFVGAVGEVPGAPLQETLQAVCALAAEGAWGARWVFGEQELARARLRPAAVDALLRARVLREAAQGAGGRGRRYAFALPGFQEFFAALWHALRFPGRDPDFQALDAARLGPLVGEPGRRRRDGLVPVALLFCGLFHAACAPAVERAFGCRLSAGNLEALAAAARWGERASSRHHGLPPLFHCLQHARGDALPARALRGCRAALLVVAKHRDLQASAFCLHSCPDLRELQLVLTLSICKEIPEGTNWRLCWWEELCSALSQQNLEALSLTNSVVELDAVQALAAALDSPGCRLHTLRLEGCWFAPGGLLELARDLSRNLRLKTLLVRRVRLEDAEASFLAEAQWERLALECCDHKLLSHQSLILPLRSNHRLTHLSLAENALSYHGARDLWCALQKARCPLQRLVLRSCSLTASCCWEAARTLVRIATLRSLDLSFNRLMDEGLALFCEALQDWDSGLQVLELERCSLTTYCDQALAHLLCTLQGLRHLDLSRNQLGLRTIQRLHETFHWRARATRVVLERKPPRRVHLALRLEGPPVDGAVLRILQDLEEGSFPGPHAGAGPPTP